MAQQRDPFYIVKDEVAESVRRRGRRRACWAALSPWTALALCAPSPATILPPLLPCLPQLRGVQSKFSRWGNLPRTSAERKGLKGEVEEECHSLEYMVRVGRCGVPLAAGAGRAAAGQAHSPGLYTRVVSPACQAGSLPCAQPFEYTYLNHRF